MAEHFNRLSPAESEALANLVEEVGEVLQAIGKIQRHGLFSRNPFKPEDPDNREQLAIECGDVLAAIEVLTHVGILDADELEQRKARKLEKVRNYLHHIEL